MDEEYLAYTLMPYIRKSEAGLALYNQILAEYRTGRNVPLIKQGFAEFDQEACISTVLARFCARISL